MFGIILSRLLTLSVFVLVSHIEQSQGAAHGIAKLHIAQDHRFIDIHHAGNVGVCNRGQSPKESDCSGSVCTALSLATGRSVRVTAEELYKRFFTEDVTDLSDRNLLYAAFFLDKDGKALHVAGWCQGKYMNMSSSEPDKSGNFRTGAELLRLYHHLKMKKRGMRI